MPSSEEFPALERKAVDDLSADHQQVLLEEALAAAKFQPGLNGKGEAAALAGLRAKGMQIVENPDTAAIRAILRDETGKLYMEKNGGAMLKAIEAAN